MKSILVGSLLVAAGLNGVAAENLCREDAEMQHGSALMKEAMDQHLKDQYWYNTEYRVKGTKNFEQLQSSQLNTGKAACIDGLADGLFACDKVDKLGFISYKDMGSYLSESMLMDPVDQNNQPLADGCPKQNAQLADTVSGSDMWGWTDPEDGREYAISMVKDGFAVIDITEPSNLRPVIFIQDDYPVAQGNTWKDVKVFNNRAYYVSENPNNGFRVFNLESLRDLRDATEVTRRKAKPEEIFGLSGWFGGRAHNIVINEDSGYAYAVGTSFGCSGGLYVIDLNTNPDVPVGLGCHPDEGYSHDCQIVNYNGPDEDFKNSELAFCNNEEEVVIIDVTDKTVDPQALGSDFPEFKTISKFDYWKEDTDEWPKPFGGRIGYVHQGWLTEDHSYFLCNDELDENGYAQVNRRNPKNATTIVLDVTNLREMKMTSYYHHTSLAVDHNLYTKKQPGIGELAYHSNYASGLRITNVTNAGKEAISTVASFDVCPELDDDLTMIGTWSNYPYFKSKVLAVSSIGRGLFTLKHHADMENPPTPGPTTVTLPPSISAANIVDYTVALLLVSIAMLL